jgi:rubredoxin
MADLKFDEIVCPSCEKIARADFVDNGVGMQQCGPFHCEACGWVEHPVELDEMSRDPELGDL